MLKVELVGKYVGHSGAVYALEADGPGQRFWSCGGDGLLAEWQPDKPDAQALLRVPEAVYALHYAPHTELLTLGLSGGGLLCYHLNTKVVQQTPAPQKASVFALTQAEDGLLLAADAAGNVQVLQAGTLERISEHHVSDQALRTLGLDPEGQKLLAAGSDGRVRLFSWPQFQLLHSWQAHAQTVFAHATLPDGGILTAGRDARLALWTAQGICQTQVVAHRYSIHALALHPSARWVATGSMDKDIRIWQVQDLRLLEVLTASRLDAHTSSVNSLKWLDDKRLLSVSDDRTVRLWHLDL